jgi:cephalosporin hydroxylase
MAKDKADYDPVAAFAREKRSAIAGYAADDTWRRLSLQWLELAFRRRYMYNFTSLGRPIIQLPTDMVALQEIIWEVRPDLIVETGIAHGGSLIQSAALLALLDYCDAAERGIVVDPATPGRRVLAIDIDIRNHNRAAIEAHPLAKHISMIEGSSIEPEVIRQVRDAVAGKSRVLVCLDSNHTHDHVLAELEAYAPMASVGSYCIVFDTVVEDMPADLFPDRPWAPGNSPGTAVAEFLMHHPEFEIDRAFEQKLLITAAPGGYLKRVRS